jgi:DNA-binding response OmpR family regulator
MRKKTELKGIKVLLVEDDNFLSEILKTALSADGANLFVAEFAREALTIAHKEMPDIILTDLMLSGINGEEFIASLKSNSALKSIPVVVFSSLASKRTTKANHALGVAEYHVKSETNLSDIPTIILRVIKESKKKKSTG